MEPDSVVRFFAPQPVSADRAHGTLLNYSRWYRTTTRSRTSPALCWQAHFQPALRWQLGFARRVASRPTPSPTRRRARTARRLGPQHQGHRLLGTSSRTTPASPVVALNLVYGGKTVTDPPASSFPLVLTTIRCVEHFQGGPITRNNWFNVELEPEPWIEINSADACARTASRTGLRSSRHRPHGRRRRRDRRTRRPTARASALAWGRAHGEPEGRPGVVAIPWHWGEKGLSTGSRANDLCIDAMDANTTIPEYKACLCRIEKI